MINTFDSQTQSRIHRPRLERGISLVDQCFDTLFDKAPVMMASIDEYWRLVRVNGMWLQTLGYEHREVLGRGCVDFLTMRSRNWALNDALPLFWRTGSARRVGYEMVRKDGRVMNVLMDADLNTGRSGAHHALMSIRSNFDLPLGEHSCSVLAGLTGLVQIRSAMESLVMQDDPTLTSEPSEVGDSAEPSGGAPGQDRLLDLLVMACQVSTTLRSLASALADSAESLEDRQQSLVELAEAVTALSGKIPWLTAPQRAASG